MNTLFLMFLLASDEIVKEEAIAHEIPMVYKWVNFGILMALFVWLCVKFLGPALRERAAAILESLASASKRGAEVEAKAAEVEKKLAGLAAEIESIKKEARDEMAREAKKFADETAELLAKVEHAAQGEIESAKKAAIKEIHAHSAQLALDLARQKVQSRMSPPAQDALVDGFIRNLN